MQEVRAMQEKMTRAKTLEVREPKVACKPFSATGK